MGDFLRPTLLLLSFSGCFRVRYDPVPDVRDARADVVGGPDVRDVPEEEVATEAGTVDPFTGVEGGFYFTCGTLQSTGVACWGRNRNGQLGDTTMLDRAVPVRVSMLDNVTSLSAGESHVCAMRTSGEIVCWGDNTSGQLGDGTNVSRPRFATVPGLTGVSKLMMGTQHSCALRTDGTVLCWGSNANAQLGTVGAANASSPTAVVGITDAIDIGSGSDHTCVVHMGGTVSCWGANTGGQLGDPATTANAAAPVLVAGLTDAVEVCGGDAFSCARRQGGTVVCWGRNESGQLGNALSGPQETMAVAVDGITDAVQLTCGGWHGCVIRTGGGGLCWGWNSRGQVAQAANVVRSPLATPTLMDATWFSGGAEHTCVLRPGGEVRCVGGNYSGELGNGTTTHSDVAVTAVSVR